MKNTRTLIWRAALRGLRGGPPQEAVREERLRAASGIGALALSSWRGRSGRRIVVAVHAPEAVDPSDCDGAVLLAVARDAEGRSRVAAAATAETLRGAARREAWLAGVVSRGASEIHVHRLAGTAAARGAVWADLAPDAARRPEQGGGAVAVRARAPADPRPSPRRGRRRRADASRPAAGRRGGVPAGPEPARSGATRPDPFGHEPGGAEPAGGVSTSG